MKMNRQEFLQDKNVVGFSQWLKRRAHDLKVSLDIKHSPRFVPGGVKEDCKGLGAVLSCYKWRGDWTETQKTLESLRSSLHAAMKNAADNEDELLRSCMRIAEWGGDRSGKRERGAGRFLKDKKEKVELASYLRDCGGLLNLELANLEHLAGIEEMNSMLTKIHALLAGDGLPIYDSRVAAAIAALVEMWRRDCGLSSFDLPEVLRFPAVSQDKRYCRRVICLFPDASDPGVLRYKSNGLAVRWANAKVRLGWLMHETLKGEKGIFESAGDLSGKMRAFEAALFMIGYDLKCLRSNY